jgi:hypothetical protein
MSKLYFESQSAALCGMHAINTLLQVRLGRGLGIRTISEIYPWSGRVPPCSRRSASAPPSASLRPPFPNPKPTSHPLPYSPQGPYFTEFDLAQIAQDLDAKEKELLGAAGVSGLEFGNVSPYRPPLFASFLLTFCQS